MSYHSLQLQNQQLQLHNQQLQLRNKQIQFIQRLQSQQLQKLQLHNQQLQLHNQQLQLHNQQLQLQQIQKLQQEDLEEEDIQENIENIGDENIVGKKRKRGYRCYCSNKIKLYGKDFTAYVCPIHKKLSIVIDNKIIQIRPPRNIFFKLLPTPLSPHDALSIWKTLKSSSFIDINFNNHEHYINVSLTPPQ